MTEFVALVENDLSPRFLIGVVTEYIRIAEDDSQDVIEGVIGTIISMDFQDLMDLEDYIGMPAYA